MPPLARLAAAPRALRRALATLNAPSPADISHFRSIVGAPHVLTEPDDVAPYNVDWLRQYRGSSACVVRPRSTAEVSAVLARCHTARVGVVPQGGNTGLVGGGVPRGAEVVLSLARLAGVESFDEDAGVVACGAGTTLGALEEALNARGHTAPLDLGSKGSCHVGGNAATNAGGLRLLRWGSLHGSVVGLEAVAADGTVLDMMSALRKDNVGFDVKQLFIGSEGALGVVTRVALLAPRRPAARNVAMLAVPSWPAARALLRAARDELGEVLSAAEFVDAAAMRLTLDGLRRAAPLAAPAPGAPEPAFYFFVETAGARAAHDAEKLGDFLSGALAAGTVTDGALAADEAKARALFALREDVSVALTARGHVFKYDVSLALGDMYALVEAMRARLSGRGWDARGVVTVGYGHIGDGNLHLNISTPGRAQEWLPELGADIEPFVYEWVLERGGSVSAEHGVGQAKVAWLPRARAPAVVALMRRLKDAMDPCGILNPGKVLAVPGE